MTPVGFHRRVRLGVRHRRRVRLVCWSEPFLHRRAAGRSARHGCRRAEPPPSCTGLRCSRDIKRVVDGCTGEVVQECGPSRDVRRGVRRPMHGGGAREGIDGLLVLHLPPEDPGWAGSCFAAMVANTWDRPRPSRPSTARAARSRRVDLHGGHGRDRAKYTKLEGPLPPGQVAIVFLSEKPPRRPPRVRRGSVGALGGDPIASTARRSRRRSRSRRRPVSAYSIYPYGGAKTYFPTATLLLPDVVVEHELRRRERWPMTRDRFGDPLGAYPTLQIVASSRRHRGAHAPEGRVYDGAASSGPRRKTRFGSSARGEVLQITQPEELTEARSSRQAGRRLRWEQVHAHPGARAGVR